MKRSYSTSKEVVGNGKTSGIFHEMQVEISVTGTDNSTLKLLLMERMASLK